MHCPSCHSPVAEGVVFCSQCGHNLLETHKAYFDGLRAFYDGRFDQALRKFKVALLTDPGNPEIIKDCGHAYLHNGDLGAALDMYERAETLGGNFFDADYNRAMSLMSSQRFAEARELLQRVVAAPGIEVRQGQFYLGLHFATSEAFLADCHLRLGICEQELGGKEEARGQFRRALDYDPESVPAYLLLGHLALREKHFAEATQYFEGVLSRSSLPSEMTQARAGLGLACYENGQIEEAIRHLNLALQGDPGNPTAIHYLNHIYEREGIIEKSQGAIHPAHFMDIREGASPIFGLVEDARESQLDAPATEAAGLSIIGRSQPMLRMMRHARLAAASDSTVLITGENGSGKELIARMIYLNSARADQPFVVVNCAAIPETLLESDLFGHEKGAFTGATARKPGRFELAHGGTIFLDEIGDLSPTTQVKLLRALQERAFTRVGGTEEIHVDVRILAATNRNLQRLIEEGLFREDLYYRLNVIPIHVPPLRERKEDIPLLVEHFLRKFARRNPKARVRFSREDLEALQEYSWPGNVRELENMIERTLVMGAQPGVYLEELRRHKRPPQTDKPASPPPAEARTPRETRALPGESAARFQDSNFPLTLAEVERRHILQVLQMTGGNQRKAAQILGINPSTLWRKLRAYQIDPATFSPSSGPAAEKG